MATDIYTFSGAGNSLHVARELQSRLPDSNLVSIVRLLRQETIETRADTVGLVFPNFCLTVPIPVHDFLEKANVGSAKYMFAVCTRGGTPSEAFDTINAQLRKQDKELNAQMNVTMPWNHPLGEENLPALATSERIEELEADMQRKLDTLSAHILEHEPYLRPDTDASYEMPGWSKAMASLIPLSVNYELHRFMYQDLVRFYSDSGCNGCSICESVCLSHKIEIVGERPFWKEDVTCYGCFACINFCPQQALQIRSRFPVQSSTAVNDRYHHPSVTYRDIAEQR